MTDIRNERPPSDGSELPPAAGYSHSRRSGTTIYVSGQTSVGPAGDTMGSGDFAAQFAQVFRNLEIVLRGHGASLSNLLKTTAYLTNSEDISEYRRLRDEKLQAPLPASTLVVVSGLVREEFLLEIEAVAVVPDSELLSAES